MPLDWSPEEVEATVADYFTMLRKELAREPYNKRDHNRALQELLRNRSAGAIEFKHANISAVLIEQGYPYIDGYKPRSNYQELLREAVIAHLERDHVLRAVADDVVNAQAVAPTAPLGWDAVVVPPPTRERERPTLYERPAPVRRPILGINYLEREARNRSLGSAGEEFVLHLEHDRLWKAGADRLADRVERVSQSRGDGLGYDILSFEASGRERLIEVKTTRFGAMTPFFASANEVAVSSEAAEQYHLYRLYKFEERPKLFVLPGALRESVLLEPVVYRATLP